MEKRKVLRLFVFTIVFLFVFSLMPENVESAHSSCPGSCDDPGWECLSAGGGGEDCCKCLCGWASSMSVSGPIRCCSGGCYTRNNADGCKPCCSPSAWQNTNNYRCAAGDYSTRQIQQTRTESCSGPSTQWVNLPCPVDLHCEGSGTCELNCGDGLLDLDDLDGWSEECDSNIDTCGVFGESCDAVSCGCSYYLASLTTDVTPVCMNNTNSKDFVVSGTSEYCGDITITVYYDATNTEQHVFDQDTYDDYTFRHTFTIPDSISIPPSDPILIEVRGNRIDLQDDKDDPDPVYVCGEDLILVVGYQNFYYFPEPGRTFHPDYDVYINDSYYNFYNDGDLYDWDEKKSDVTIWTCADNATDCVDNSEQSVDAGTLTDADDDDEYELCYSRDNIQGGWLDLDVSSDKCALLDGQFGRESEWFDCQPSNQCFYGVDDFAPDEPGLCCGDDYGEIIHYTQSKFDTDPEYIFDDGVPRTYDACCEEQNTHSCVDERGICRQEGYDYCLSSGGVKATCVVPTPGGLGEWELIIEENCISSCELCDINNDGVMDITDTTAISNNFNDSTDGNNPYNVNNDTVVDIHDVEFCNPYIGEVCWGCGDNTLDSDEGCENITGNYQFSCPETACDNKVKLTRDDNSCSPLCTCEYTRSCDTSECGGCEVDEDCSGGKVCNPNTCGCVDYIPGEEYSIHIYETDCSYKLCVSGGGNNAEPDVTIGTITTTTTFTTWGTENFEVNDIINLNTDENVISFKTRVTTWEDCIVFETDGAVTYDIEDGEECSGQGEAGPNPSLGPNDPNNECCSGLDALAPASIFNSECDTGGLTGYGTVCSDCGNGVCDSVENECNCPEDCDCAEQGEGIGIGPDTLDCCSGLDTIPPKSIYDSNCEYGDMTGWSYLCSDCGNDICEDWESECNCPEDCATEYCGDGILQPGEECDNGVENSNILPDACREDCTWASCGDAVCDSEEDESNCAEDCDVECVEEGEAPTNIDLTTGQPILDGKECCEGLKAIGPKIDPEAIEKGLCSELSGTLGICRPCGNGVCDSGYEDECNCPEDCETFLTTARIYFEPYDTHPEEIPFEYSTPMSNECRECIPTEDPETTLNDGIDNDCDGLTDEPIFRDEYSVYIWESNCDYYICANAKDSVDHETTGELVVENGYEFYNVGDIDWESNDDYSLNSNIDKLTFRSLIYNDEDCLVFNADTLIEYDLDLNGSKDTDDIFLTQDTFNPYTNPFRFANPECSLSCTDPGDCGSAITGCSYEECIFDCGGYWIDGDHILSPLIPFLGDTCEDCEDDMNCSNYNNEPTCHYDPCGASLSHFGCSWNEDSEICEDALPECMPGTTLCQDGTCSDDCDDTDEGNQGCINDNDECDLGEGCACEDCEGEQDSCTEGAICGEDEICGCPEETTLCNDGTCSEDCDETDDGNAGCIDDPNDKCELGEGCACEDCDGFQDSCVDGTVCNYYEEECIEFVYGDCPPGTTLCNDLTCDETCEDNGGKRGCIGEPNDRCESGEGCACGDCHNKRDSCERGSICNFDYELCEERYSNGGGDDYEHCDDDDDDGYYEIDEDCIGSDDCNDNNANIHPGALEICNNIDDDCDGQIDENCIDQNFALDLSLDISKKLRVVDKFQIKATIRNNIDKDFSDLRVMLEVPAKFKINQRSVIIDKIGALETKEIYFDGLILDYNQETAMFTLKAMFPDSDIITREIPVFIEIPEFLIAAEPRYDYLGVKCLDFYYAINQPGLYDPIDIEFDVNNPKSFLGKSVVVDYVSSVNPQGKIIVKPMISNPYCLPKGTYQTKGYLYKAGPYFVDTIGESTEILIIS